jgi:tetratricopeptide (TPR) repeat protein
MDAKGQFQRAVALHQAGRLDEAGHAYADVLAKNAKHFEALSLLAIIHAQRGNPLEALRLLDLSLGIRSRQPVALNNRGLVLKDLARHEEAINSFSKAIKLKPDYAEAYCNLGDALAALGRFVEATLHYDKAIAINATGPRAHSNRGNALLELMRYEEALSSFERAIARDENYPDAHYNRGNALAALGRYGEAVSSYEKTIAIAPTFPDAYNRRGVALSELGRHDDALASFERAILLKNDFAEACYNCGIVLGKLKRFALAAETYDRAIAIDPGYAAAHNNRANALSQLGRYAEAMGSCDKAISLKPDYAEAHNNRGTVLNELGRLDEAITSFERAIALKPDYADAYSNLGNALSQIRRYPEALACYDKSIAINPEFADAHRNKGLAHLAAGEFAVGWEHYEWRLKTEDFVARTRELELPLWIEREKIRNSNLLLCAEQGVGDEIMFAGMIAQACDEARNVTIECDARLATLYQRSFPTSTVVARGAVTTAAARSFDAVMPVGSLARFFRTTAADFPTHAGYLKPCPVLAEKWRNQLNKLGPGFKVGISWRGGLKKTGAERRSIPLEKWDPILNTPGVLFVSLQYGNVSEDQALWSDRITFFEDAQSTFDELAALISELDLVISVQTAAIHLTGAIGKSCWALVSDPAEWRYGQSGVQMPWYPAVRLIRQKTPGNWQAVVEQVTKELLEISTARL